MTLSDCEIWDEVMSDFLVIKPWAEHLLQPCSLDVRLDNTFRRFEAPPLPAGEHHRPLDPTEPQAERMSREILTDRYVLQPGGFVLASTLEWVEIPNYLVAHVEGKSSLGRLGLLVHCTAGLIDPGFRGHITLEVFNASPLPIALIPTMPIAQLTFDTLSSPPKHTYGSADVGSRYQNQRRGPVPSRGVDLR